MPAVLVTNAAAAMVATSTPFAVVARIFLPGAIYDNVRIRGVLSGEFWGWRPPLVWGCSWSGKVGVAAGAARVGLQLERQGWVAAGAARVGCSWSGKDAPAAAASVDRARDFPLVPSPSWRHSMHLPCRPPAAAGPGRGALRTPGRCRYAAKPTGEALQLLMRDVGWHVGEDVGRPQLTGLRLHTKPGQPALDIAADVLAAAVCALLLQSSSPCWPCLDGCARLLPRRSRRLDRPALLDGGAQLPAASGPAPV